MSVIVLGETGTGKEYVANAIHQQSPRSGGPFVAVDCGALPQELAGSELFGHVKGAFTGAVAEKKGCFELADGGTLFLDEIGNLSYENQVKLLRILQEREVKRIGDTKAFKVDVRVIVATNEDLRQAVQTGDFREDIYHRLNEFAITLNPLRKRRKDIPLFADHFLSLANEQLQKTVVGFEPDALSVLTMHQWHGNLREISNVVKRAVLLCNSEKIKVEHLPPEIRGDSAFLTSSGAASNKLPVTLKEVVEQAERIAIIEMLEHTAGNKSKTAQLLDVDRKTLYNKMKAYEIN
jgi:two-component system response regulator HydG